MKERLSLILRLFGGFMICAVGVVMMINSNLGLSPWDVLHQGVTNIIDITIGQASILAGLIVVIISSFLGVKIGLGTILNMIFIGLFIDAIIMSNIIPVSENFLSGIIMLITGMILLGFGSVLYMSCELGCGPRDGLMSALSRITNKPIKLIRAVIELGAMSLGWLLGGFLGIGTFITAIGLGYCFQFSSRLLKLDIVNLKHRNITDDIKEIKKVMLKKAS